jgi:peptidoglycan/xylan/chitin deacetylase (PgdA/CDA1 family)
MRISAIDGIRQAARSLWNRHVTNALILMYHRVAEVNSDPWWLSVTPQHFAEHLEILRKHMRPIHLQELTKVLPNGNIPRQSVAVTFDDGYADNLYNAKPLLEKHDVPATIFLVTGYLGQDREFWWDELDRLLLRTGVLPGSLCLNINGSTYHWEQREDTHHGKDDHSRQRDLNDRRRTPSSRYSLYRALWQLLQPLLESERQSLLNELLVWANAKPQARPTHRILSFQEVITLARGELIEVGSHTVTHPVLSTLPAVLQRDEILRSKATLEEMLKHPVNSFSYPYGNYTSQTVAIIRESGFTCACSTAPRAVERGADRFQLPRIEVQDWDGEEFARQLASRWKTVKEVSA